MKKFIVLSACLLSLNMVGCANDKTISVTEIPNKSQKFLKTHFADSKVAYATKDKELLDVTYDVTFVNGDNVEFDKKGEWKEVDCKKSSVPVAIIPKHIADYVTQNYKGVKILSIDRDKTDYEIELSNKLDLKFDLKFNLVEIDN